VSKVFISYSRQDSDFADKLTKSLEEKGVGVWVDRSEIKGGSDWRRDISDAIRNCRAFLLILSSRSTVSENVDDELYLAKEKNRPIFPVLYETCELPPGVDLVLSRQQRIVFADVPFEKALQQVLDALGHDLGVSEPPPQPPDPPLKELICARWNIVSVVGRTYLEIYPNGTMRGQFTSAYISGNVSGNWQIMPNGMLSLMGQTAAAWRMWPFMLNINFNQVTPEFLTGVCLDGTVVTWYRVG